jgi:hypothetical protein
MSTHTQKPWRWVEGTDAIDVDWNGKSWTIATVGNCRLGWHEDKNCEGREAGANARLIAAAPDLLQELRNIANADTAEWDDRSEFEAWAKSRARFAIANATGCAQ